MKNILSFALLLMLCFTCVESFGQQIAKPDSIFFNLYTDSLKKGTYNYINVDGKFSNGTYLPMTTKDLEFSCSYGHFEGNSLFIDSSCKEEKIKIKVVLKSDTSVSKEREIYIKKYEEVPKLKTMKEVMEPQKRSRRNER